MNAARMFLSMLGLMILLSACAPRYVTKNDAFPEMYKERPLSILVLPPINMTTAADAKEYYATTIAEPLSYAGYYVYPIEVTTDILKNEGLDDTEALLSVPLEKFRQFFGADAVLYVKLLKWNTSYFVIGGNVTVAVDCVLKSTKTSRELWKYSGSITIDTSGDSGGTGGLAALLVKVVVTAIKTATTDYVPIAKRVNVITISSMPYGKYNPNFDKDRKFQIVSKQQPASPK